MFLYLSTLSFYLGLTACSSTSALSPTIVLEYSIGGGPFIIMQVLVINGMLANVLYAYYYENEYRKSNHSSAISCSD